MLPGIMLSLVAIAGIVVGVVRRNRIIVFVSVIALVLIVAVGAFFWYNPY